MNTKAETATSAMDHVKWAVAVGLVVAGFYGFYHFEAQILAPLRVAGLLATMAVAVVVAATTAKGRTAVSFMKSANIERQKVVWPTRPETVQTTLVVLVVVVIVGILIWFIDWIFAGIVSALVG